MTLRSDLIDTIEACLTSTSSRDEAELVVVVLADWISQHRDDLERETNGDLDHTGCDGLSVWLEGDDS